MTVAELKEFLESCNENARVYLKLKNDTPCQKIDFEFEAYSAEERNSRHVCIEGFL